MTVPPTPDLLTGALESLEGRGHRIAEVLPMAGDVSRRAYFRLRIPTGTAILALYPPDLAETCSRYLETTRLLDGVGVRVPRVPDQDCRAGWALLEDLGPRTLYEERERPWSELTAYFEAAAAAARRIAELPADAVAGLNPPLDRDLLARELGQTRETLLEPLGVAGGPEVDAALGEICERLGAEPAVACHRDFGARNLMPLGGPAAGRGQATVGVLDHQDLRLGPPAYDLASLLNDSLFPPAELEARLVAEAPVGRESYHRAAAQRTLKAVGSYAAFAHRGTDRHLPLIAPTLGRALDHLRRVPETATLTELFEALWRPLADGRIDPARALLD
jgi:aminoglycoside/choline kinase family phosphotransferase